MADDLAEESPGFQDFVIAHELLHLRVPNHGKLFKALMTVHIPGWRRHEVERVKATPPRPGSDGESARLDSSFKDRPG